MDQRAAVALYTAAPPPTSANARGLAPSALAHEQLSRGRVPLDRLMFARLVVHTMSLLPRTRVLLARGCVVDAWPQYRAGDQFVHCTPVSGVASSELVQEMLPDDGVKQVHYIIDCAAVDLRGLSQCELEREFVLLPGAVLEVEGASMAGESLMLVRLREIDDG